MRPLRATYETDRAAAHSAICHMRWALGAAGRGAMFSALRDMYTAHQWVGSVYDRRLRERLDRALVKASDQLCAEVLS